MNVDTGLTATIDEPAAGAVSDEVVAGPENRHPKWRRNYREAGSTPPAPLYGPRKPLREVRAEHQAAKATEV